MLRRFRLEEPESVAEVSELLARFGDSAKIYVGGTELLLAMKEGFAQYERLINIKKLTALSEISHEDGKIKIGALCTHHQLETSTVLQQQLPSLVKFRSFFRPSMDSLISSSVLPSTNFQNRTGRPSVPASCC